jgi:hypothetical protein
VVVRAQASGMAAMRQTSPNRACIGVLPGSTLIFNPSLG